MFDYREFDNLLASRGVARECPMCGTTDRHIADKRMALIEVDDRGDADVVQGAAARIIVSGAVICSDCGFIRLHALRNFGLDGDLTQPS